MNIRYEERMKILSPDEGKFLTDEETYTDGEVYMKYDADHSMWYEVDDKPEPPEPEPQKEISDTDALNIITGTNTE